MDLHTFVSDYDVEHSKDLIKEGDLIEIAKAMGVQIGKELKDYLLRYGYLAFRDSELYGVNSKQFLKSDMVRQTIFLHVYCPVTKGFVAIEKLGDSDYFLVDEKDYIYEFNAELGNISPTNETLYEYILHRFKFLQNE